MRLDLDWYFELDDDNGLDGIGFDTDGIEVVMAVCLLAFNGGAVVRCLLVGLQRWRGDPLLACQIWLVALRPSTVTR